MKFYYSPYQLKNKNKSNSVREGALIRCEWKNETGYADLCPLPEVKDLSISEQIKNFQSNKISALFQQSLFLAKRDARARMQKKNLFDQSNSIKNNFLITHVNEFDLTNLEKIKSMGFATIKLKMGNDIEKEILLVQKICKQGFKLRLDPVKKIDLNYFLSKVAPTHSHIEYIEDPEQLMSDKFKVAIDTKDKDLVQIMNLNKPFQYLIIKPAKINAFEAVDFCLNKNIQFTITSYMDHPIGQLHALSMAQEIAQKSALADVGCFTHEIYERNKYSDLIETNGPYIKPISGFGVGYDELLEKEDWKYLGEFQ